MIAHIQIKGLIGVSQCRFTGKIGKDSISGQGFQRFVYLRHTKRMRECDDKRMLHGKLFHIIRKRTNAAGPVDRLLGRQLSVAQNA